MPEAILAREAMALVCAYHGVKPREDLMRRFGLNTLKNKQYGKMSTGQKRRLQLALGTPEQVTAAGSSQTRITLRTRHGSLLKQGSIQKASYLGQSEGFAQWICSDAAPAVMELLNAAMNQEDPVDDLRVERPSLEERFLEIVEGGKTS